LEELYWNFMQIRGLGDGLWFVAALFVSFVPFYCFIRQYEKGASATRCWLLLGISFLLSLISNIYKIAMDPALLPWNVVALPWHIEYIFIAMFYMVLGYLFRTKFEEKMEKYNSVGFCLLLSALYLVTIFIGKLWIHNMYVATLYNYLEELFGIAAVISLCKLLPADKLVLYIGQNTLLCFALHGKVYSLLQTLFRKLIPGLYYAILNNTLLSSAFSVLLTVSLSLILLTPIWCINRWLPYTIGRKKLPVKKVTE